MLDRKKLDPLALRVRPIEGVLAAGGAWSVDFRFYPPDFLEGVTMFMRMVGLGLVVGVGMLATGDAEATYRRPRVVYGAPVYRVPVYVAPAPVYRAPAAAPYGGTGGGYRSFSYQGGAQTGTTGSGTYGPQYGAPVYRSYSVNANPYSYPNSYQYQYSYPNSYQYGYVYPNAYAPVYGGTIDAYGVYSTGRFSRDDLHAGRKILDFDESR